MAEPAPPPPALDPLRNDPLLRPVSRALGGRPAALAAAFLAASLGGTALLAGLGDLVRGTAHLAGLLADRQNVLNLGVVLPLAAAALFRYYAALPRHLGRLLAAGSVRFPDAAAEAAWVADLDRALNRRAFPWIALAAALGVNALFLQGVERAWNALDAGPHAWWFRLVALANVYALVHLLLKAAAVARALRRLFAGGRSLRLQPLHPDGCGGLRSLGSLAMALVAFIGVIGLYLAVLAVVPDAEGRTAMGFALFAPTCLGYAALALYLFLAPLTGAHAAMKAARLAELARLHAAFAAAHARLVASLGLDAPADAPPPLDEDAARRVEALQRLHRLTAELPTWPFDLRILAQVAGAMAVPPLVALFRALLRSPLG